MRWQNNEVTFTLVQILSRKYHNKFSFYVCSSILNPESFGLKTTVSLILSLFVTATFMRTIKVDILLAWVNTSASRSLAQ